jgi:hypothetical protein
MLQPHVLKTLIGHFITQNCEIDAYETIIKDSQMQPFLISVTLNPKKKCKKILVHKLNGTQKEFSAGKYEEFYKEINNMQLSIGYGNRVKKLSLGQHLQFNVFDQKQNVRYLLEVIDSSEEKILHRNTCAVFIAPQGKENSFLYGSEQGLKMLHDQVASSRVIVAKLMSGSVF